MTRQRGRPGMRKIFISEKQRDEEYSASTDSGAPGGWAGKQDMLHAGLHIIGRIWDLGPSAMGC